MMELSKEYLALKAATVKAMLLSPITPITDEQRLEVQCRKLGKPMKTLKSVTIEAEFGELKGGRTHQVGRGKGSNFKAAAAAAMRDLLKQKGLKAQRFTTCKAVISFGTITEG